MPRAGIFGKKSNHHHNDAQEEQAELQNELSELREEFDDTKSRLEIAVSTSRSLEEQYILERDSASRLGEALEVSEARCAQLEQQKVASEEHRKAAAAQLASEAVTHKAKADEAKAQLATTERSLASLRSEMEALQRQPGLQDPTLQQRADEANHLQSEVRSAQERARQCEAAEAEQASRVRELRSALDGTEASIARAQAEASRASEERTALEAEVERHQTASQALQQRFQENGLSAHLADLERLQQLDAEVRARDRLVLELRAQIEATPGVPSFSSTASPAQVKTTNGAHSAQAGRGDNLAEAEHRLEQSTRHSVELLAELNEAEETCSSLRVEYAALRDAQSPASAAASPANAADDPRQAELQQLRQEIEVAEQNLRTKAAKNEELQAELLQEQTGRAALVQEALCQQNVASDAALQGAEASKDELMSEIRAMRNEIYAERSDFTVKFADGLAEKTVEHTAVLHKLEAEANLMQCTHNELRAEISSERSSSTARTAEALAEKSAEHSGAILQVEVSADLLRHEEAHLRAELLAERSRCEEHWKAGDPALEVGRLEANSSMLQQEAQALEVQLQQERSAREHLSEEWAAKAATEVEVERLEAEITTMRAEVAEERAKADATAASGAAAEADGELEDLRQKAATLQYGLQILSEDLAEGSSSEPPKSVKEAMRLQAECAELSAEVRYAKERLAERTASTAAALPPDAKAAGAEGPFDKAFQPPPRISDVPSLAEGGLAEITHNASCASTADFGRESQPMQASIASSPAEDAQVAELRSQLREEQAVCRRAREELIDARRIADGAAPAGNQTADRHLEQHLTHELSEEVARSRRLAEHAWRAEEGRNRLLTELGEAVEFEADLTSLAKQVGRAAK
eukprot:CAMPEP_0178424578 /NCGR_PEP_ID=MMETSP0689_2-20121128/28281_1 /TAXON_ID=160604 /ORGANISM="Amphidinium massartii, Strain CS-259" /LENGTH=873 /DNA_ID=CAMNT_0020046217 /DNA_START=29 /DNA_END=2647 /DNA_ORIENTATION=-